MILYIYKEIIKTKISEVKNSVAFKVIVISVGIFGLVYILKFDNCNPAEVNKNMDAFYAQSFSTIVISSNIYLSKSTEFHLKNGLNVYLMLPADDKILIGDSIKKDASTYFYNVYRKNSNNNYDLFGVYNYEDAYLNKKVK